MRDYYEILGVSPNSETEVITAAYKALMKKYHPDTNKSDDAAAKAQEINEAYETLKDPELRRQYDERRKGADQRQGSSAPPPPPKSDAGNDSRPSGNIFVTNDGALRVWLILAFSFVSVALFFDSVHISRSDPLWVADALGGALASFGIAYAVARLWKALSAQDVDQKTHRLRWFGLQALVLALMIYGQSIGRSEKPENAAPIAARSTSAEALRPPIATSNNTGPIGVPAMEVTEPENAVSPPAPEDFVGRYAHDEILGFGYLDLPIIGLQLERIVGRNRGIAETVFADAVSGPITQRFGQVIYRACEPHNCADHNWSVSYDTQSGSVTLCYFVEWDEGIIAYSDLEQSVPLRPGETCY